MSDTPIERPDLQFERSDSSYGIEWSSIRDLEEWMDQVTETVNRLAADLKTVSESLDRLRGQHQSDLSGVGERLDP